MEEQWKPIPGFDGLYSVSTQGLVRRDKKRMRFPAGGLIAQHYGRRYWSVILFDAAHVPHHVAVHRLVVMAHIGPIPKGYEVNHKDANRNNNTVQNLEIVTHKENLAHADKLGLRSLRGSANVTSRLTESQVIDIRSRPKYVQTARALATEFGVRPCTIERIRRRGSWTHV